MPERCILAGLDLRRCARAAPVRPDRMTVEESVAELSDLARGAGAEVVGQVVQVRERPVAATLLGGGKIREIQAWAAEEDCDFVLFDHDLTPSQHRNLVRELECSVLDRTQLILDVFAKHARSREGRLQVELAQLDYLLPRLVGQGAAMSRLGGGIGTRGPGETRLEHDRRKIRTRISKLRAQLEKVRTTRRLQRAKRVAVPIPTVALCGYTNAGKSTLFNALTSASVLADQRMFATLDPTLRKLRLPSHRPAIISDTVGFIRKLPPALISAFRATLEEVTEASLILHVVDISSENSSLHRQEVHRVLEELGASGKPQVLVLNKIDLIGRDKGGLETHGEGFGKSEAAVAVSAKTGQGLEHLLEVVDGILARGLVRRREFRVPYEDWRVLALLYDRAHVLDRRDLDTEVEVTAEVSLALAEQLERYVIDNHPSTRSTRSGQLVSGTRSN